MADERLAGSPSKRTSYRAASQDLGVAAVPSPVGADGRLALVARGSGVPGVPGPAYWRWARAPANDRWCAGILGLRIWRGHCAHLPHGPGRAMCPRYGLTSAVARALERRLCEPTGRLPQRAVSALMDVFRPRSRMEQAVFASRLCVDHGRKIAPPCPGYQQPMRQTVGRVAPWS